MHMSKTAGAFIVTMGLGLWTMAAGYNFIKLVESRNLLKERVMLLEEKASLLESLNKEQNEILLQYEKDCAR